MKGSGIRDVHPVQEGEEVHDADEGQDVPVDAGHELPLGGVRGTLNAELFIARVDGARIIGVAARECPLSLFIFETRARCWVCWSAVATLMLRSLSILFAIHRGDSDAFSAQWPRQS